MQDREPEKPSEILELLGYDYVREILVATSQEPMSAKDLGDELGADLSTIYRHTENMAEHNLLTEKTRISEDGSHHSVYVANVDHIDIDIDNDKLTVDITVRESPAERFTRVWDDIRES